MKESSTAPPRYAIYYTPPEGSLLALFANSWLGRDIDSPEERDQIRIPGMKARRFHTLTASPRHYGFHATLKAPFYLASGHDETDLLAAMENFAADHKTLPVLPLRLAVIGSFLCLSPAAGFVKLSCFAGEIVRKFDIFRAPITAGELRRRFKADLSCRQQEYTRRWGYPYVFEEYRFHLTLTDKIRDMEERKILLDVLPSLLHMAELEVVTVNALSLLKQDTPQAPFLLIDRFLLQP